MTGAGWLIVLALIGFFAMLILIMLPSYMEYYKIVSTLESLEEESGLETPQAIRRLIERRFDIRYRVQAKYESRKHLFANVYVVMTFDKQVTVKSR
jgi:hypothetical protein